VGSGSNFSSGARRQAAHILSQPPFTTRPGHVPDPLGGVLRDIGHWLGDIGRPFARLWKDGFSLFHGVFGSFTDPVLIIAAVTAGGLVAWRLIRRRTRIGVRQEADAQAATSDRAADLEAAAAAAEDEGDLEAAVRLRFRAGLVRLESAGIIAGPLVTTTEHVSQALRNRTFDHLAERHEAIAYAGSTASPVDATSAREGWPRVIDEVRPRPGRKPDDRRGPM
jgi:hypothetical protein